MSTFAKALTESVESYIALRRSLGYQFRKQAAALRSFHRYVTSIHAKGPLSQALVMDFVMASALTANGRETRFGVMRRFAEYHTAYDPRTERLDPRALPRSRAIPPPRILSENELRALMAASEGVSAKRPLRGQTLATVVGLLASTGLRSGEALRLDRSDVDLATGTLTIRQTKFRKDRLVPVHPSTLTALRDYARVRDLAFPAPRTPAFFVSIRGTRLSNFALQYGFGQACRSSGIHAPGAKPLRPHDLRHRFAVTRLAEWHRENTDVQSMLPYLATYLGHVRYSDTAYYVTATSELLGLASAKAFDSGGVA